MVVYNPNSNAVLADRAAKSPQPGPTIENPDAAPYGGTINGLSVETPNDFAQSLYVNGVLQTYVK